MIENAKLLEPSAEKLTIAVLGTGTMGAAMARNLLAAGYRVRVWNRSSERAAPLAADGASVCANAAQAADGATFLLTTLWDSASVATAARDALPSLAAGGIWLQASTVGLAGARTLAVLAAEHGVDFVDIPVVGTKGPAEQGTLVVLASGEDAPSPPRCAGARCHRGSDDLGGWRSGRKQAQVGRQFLGVGAHRGHRRIRTAG